MDVGDASASIRRNDGDLGPYDHGWKDTVDLGAAETAEILVRFTDYPGRFAPVRR